MELRNRHCEPAGEVISNLNLKIENIIKNLKNNYGF